MGNSNSINSSDDLEVGDIIYRDLTSFEIAKHYGVYVGGNMIVDIGGESNMMELSTSICEGSNIKIRTVNFDEFANGKPVYKKNYKDRLPGDRTAEIALNLLKNPDQWKEYNLVFNNCEHLANYCATGKRYSNQTQIAIGLGATAIAATAAATAIGLGAIAISSYQSDDSSNNQNDDNKQKKHKSIKHT